MHPNPSLPELVFVWILISLTGICAIFAVIAMWQLMFPYQSKVAKEADARRRRLIDDLFK